MRLAKSVDRPSANLAGTDPARKLDAVEGKCAVGLSRHSHEISYDAVNLAQLLSEFSRVLPLEIHLVLEFGGASDLNIELSAHLAELIVDDGQDIRSRCGRTAGAAGSSRAAGS